MKRIGIAASKISKGNLFVYHLYVILISVLFSFSIFIVAGATVLFALVILRYVSNEIMGVEFERSWQSIQSVCMVSLTVVVALFNLFAISVNLKIPRIQD